MQQRRKSNASPAPGRNALLPWHPLESRCCMYDIRQPAG